MILSYFLAPKVFFSLTFLDVNVSASENKVKEKASVPRVIIVAVVLGIILVVIVKVSTHLNNHIIVIVF